MRISPGLKFGSMEVPVTWRTGRKSAATKTARAATTMTVPKVLLSVWLKVPRVLTRCISSCTSSGEGNHNSSFTAVTHPSPCHRTADQRNNPRECCRYQSHPVPAVWEMFSPEHGERHSAASAPDVTVPAAQGAPGCAAARCFSLRRRERDISPPDFLPLAVQPAPLLGLPPAGVRLWSAGG